MGEIQWMSCGELLECKHRHDFRRCSCENETFVDGGDDYLRIGGKDLAKIEIFEEEGGEIKRKPLI